MFLSQQASTMTVASGTSLSLPLPETTGKWPVQASAIHWPRPIGIAVGISAQLVFLWTVVQLFRFLSLQRVSTDAPFAMRDGLLSVQFGVWHSLLLYPPVRQRLTRWIPKYLYGSVYCIVTCLTLLMLIRFWATSPDIIYQLTGTAAVATACGFYASWIALAYSLHLTGVGYQTGLTPWWHWFRGAKPPARSFQDRQVYRVFRHPVYLSFLGLIWFQTRMSFDQLVLTGTWTVYILIGSYLKDERMALYVGETYRANQRRVPGFPLVVRNIGVPESPTCQSATSSLQRTSAEDCVRKAA